MTVLRRAAAALIALALLSAAALAALALPAAAEAQGPRLGPPARDAEGWVRWTTPALTPPEWARALGAPPASRAESLAFWRMATSDEGVREVAFWRLGGLYLSAGDTAVADSCWAKVGSGSRPSRGASSWAWSALRGRVGIALARGDTAGADSLLGSTSRGSWSDSDRAAWNALHARLRLALEDTTLALELATQAIRLYPGLSVTLEAVAMLEQIAAARRDTLTGEQQLSIASLYSANGDLGSALRALRRARAIAPRSAKPLWSARIAAPLRRLRRFAEARAALDSAFREHPRGPAFPVATLERARLFRDTRATDQAFRWFTHAARAAADADDAQQVWWEGGRAAETAGRWHEAGVFYARAAHAAPRRAAEAFFRAGLARFTAGRVDSACRWWAGRGEEPARFWWGLARRRLGDRAAGDSALRELAAAPGYTFYRAAARDTLGVRGWNGELETVPADRDPECPELAVAARLAAAGDDEDAGLVLSRPGASAARSAADSARCESGREPLAGARVAYAAGRPMLGVTLADRALRLAAAGRPEPSAAWARAPWLYPPAYESLLVAPRDTVVARLEPALLYAVIWQESRFNPRARSRSDALGLMQLQLPTARDVARWAGEPAPAESTLYDPAVSVHAGALYLRRLLDRFDGRISVALSAYNAGPASVPAHWRELIAGGGEALFCEIASNVDAQDYLRRILAARQAYREIRPRGPAPWR